MQIINKQWQVGLIGLVAGIILAVGAMRFSGGHAPHQNHAEQPVVTSDETSAEAAVWTCAMHPQIRQNEPGDCAICGMDLTPANESENDNPLVLEMTEAAVQLSNIQTTAIGVTSGITTGEELRLSGKVQADERLASSQVAQVGGRIEKLYVSFTGEQVSTGQKLADIYAPSLITAQQELLEAKKLAEVNPKLLEAARTKLRYWKISTEAIAAIENSGQIQETFPVYATASGVVTARRVAVGDYVQQGEALFDLMNLQRVWVLFDAYEEDLAKVNIGSIVSFTTPALPGQEFKGSIRFVDPMINPQTRVASLRVELQNRGNKLKPEMLVNGTAQPISSTTNSLLVPKSAILWTGSRSVVYLKVPDTRVPSFEYREVSLGEAIGDQYEVLDGLSVGDEVVTHGNFVIDAAAQLNNQASMMNQQVSLKEEGTPVIPDFTAETPATFQLQLQVLVEAYLKLKDALVATDAPTAAEQATMLMETIDQADMSLLNGEAQNFWMAQKPGVKAHTRKIAELKDVEAQRTQFDFLSQLLIQTIQAFGVNSEVYFVQYCPMAFNDQGASWLSAEDQVLNPYFGDVMLRCGVIKETIEPEE